MAFLSGIELEKELKNTLEDQFNPKRIKQIAYELTLGSEVYLTDSKKKKTEILNESNKTITLNPGQFALLLTNEKISLSDNIFGLISIKAGIKFKGIINVSGFHIDPGFKGQLLFSVYNAGPSKITLKKGEPYFLMWLTKLEKPLKKESVYNDEENHHQDQDGIPTQYLDSLKSGDLASPSSLSKRINKLSNEIKINYFVTTFILSTAIATCWYFYKENNNYEEGFKDGYNKKQIEEKVTNKVDLIMNKKMDSIIGTKFDKIKVIRDTVQK